MRKFLSGCRLYPLFIILVSILAARAFVYVDKMAPVDSALAVSRREFGALFVGEGLALTSAPAFASSDLGTSNPLLPQLFEAESSNLPAGLLESRLSSNVMEPPPYGMEGTDIFYPS